MKKLIGLSILGFGFVFLLGNPSNAAPGVRGAKGYVSTVATTNIIGVSSGTATLYSVLLSTGTAGTDYVVIFDSASASGLSSTLQSVASGYKMRINVSSATQNTLVVFDPPMQFKNGIMGANSTTGITSVIEFETGHVTAGY